MIETSSRELITASRQLIKSSRAQWQRSQLTLRTSQRRILPRLTGGSHLDESATSRKAPACGHHYVTIELGLDGQWVMEEVDAIRSSMPGLYVSAPYRQNGTPWTLAVCPQCAEGETA